jgi:FMN phosphatase YigB (HAD superfamily)
MRHKLAWIRAIAFDFDSVFYDSLKMPNWDRELHRIKVEVACELHPDIFTPITASEIAQESRRTHFDSIVLLAQEVQQRGGDAQAFSKTYFTLLQSRAYEHFTKKYPQIFCDQPDLRDAFRQCSGLIKHGIATNSCVENWAGPHLNTFGILDHFVPEAILGLPHSNFIPKGLHPMLFKMVIDKMSANEAESLIVEDSCDNIEKAKEHYPKLTTAFIHHGRPIEGRLPSHVDYQFTDVPEMLRAIMTARYLDRHLKVM